MESQLDSNYPDSVFEDDTGSQNTLTANEDTYRETSTGRPATKHTTFKNDVDSSSDVNGAVTDVDADNVSKYNDDVGDGEDGEGSTAEDDPTLDRSTTIPDSREVKRNTLKEVVNASKENKVNDTEKTSNDNKPETIPPTKTAKVSGVLRSDRSPGIETETSTRKHLTSLDTSYAPQARYLQQESDKNSLGSSDFETKIINDPDQTYHSSGFPSLLSHLGVNATNKTARPKKKKQTSEAKKEPTLLNAQRRDSISFAQDMKKRNESQWMRIEAVAKEKLDHYEKYAVNMTLKIRRQREQINRRSQDLLQSLAKLEEKKREEKLFDSPHGRIWRHHRSMQRRAFNLEPVSVKSQGQMSNQTRAGIEDV